MNGPAPPSPSIFPPRRSNWYPSPGEVKECGPTRLSTGLDETGLPPFQLFHVAAILPTDPASHIPDLAIDDSSRDLRFKYIERVLSCGDDGWIDTGHGEHEKSTKEQPWNHGWLQ